jgi:hypothetical protein
MEQMQRRSMMGGDFLRNAQRQQRRVVESDGTEDRTIRVCHLALLSKASLHALLATGEARGKG